MTTLDNGTARDIAECALYVLRDIFAAAHAGEEDAALLRHANANDVLEVAA